MKRILPLTKQILSLCLSRFANFPQIWGQLEALGVKGEYNWIIQLEMIHYGKNKQRCSYLGALC